MAVVYLIPAPLDEEGLAAIPPYITEAIKKCEVFFTENERTTRRYLKQLWKTQLPGEEIVIDDYEWHTIGDDSVSLFRQKIREGKTIGILSEAGCPGVADPGQILIAIAQEMNAEVKPLVGPSSILLALMGSGMNGQKFQFHGYLPIREGERIKAIRDLEEESFKKNCTQIFIETPYRNQQLTEALLRTCKPSTRLGLAVDLTGKREWIKTKSVTEWKKEKPGIQKRPAIFLLFAGH